MVVNVSRYIAFLRGINVGGHQVKMPVLKQSFLELGFGEVATFIASGNVIFDAATTDDPAALEAGIEGHLQGRLGYEVATFVRTRAELAAVAAKEPWPPASLAAGDTRYVVFLRAPLAKDTAASVLALANDRDLLAIDGPHLHWLCRGNFLDSSLSGPVLGRTIGGLTTSRNLKTVRRLAAKYPS
ncbi:MAG: DUF1697 domain-containing protein [Actinomycetota bacterium]|nr:DUF1697 domain-containing protein [Actinomycetota bacterium]